MFKYFLGLILFLFSSQLAFSKINWPNFTERMMKGDYGYCDSQIIFTNYGQQDSAHILFDQYRNKISNILLGTPLYTYSYGKTILFKLISFSNSQNVADNNQLFESEVCYVQISDGIRYVILCLAANANGKIISVGLSDEVYTVPDVKKIWMIGITVILFVLSFKIYVCIRIYKSDITRKWVKYLLALLLNVPVIGYHAIEGIVFNFFQIDILGVSISSGSYFNTYWLVGIPIGAMIVLWRLNNNLYRTKEDDWIYNVETNTTTNKE